LSIALGVSVDRLPCQRRPARFGAKRWWLPAGRRGGTRSDAQIRPPVVGTILVHGSLADGGMGRAVVAVDVEGQHAFGRGQAEAGPFVRFALAAPIDAAERRATRRVDRLHHRADQPRDAAVLRGTPLDLVRPRRLCAGLTFAVSRNVQFVRDAQFLQPGMIAQPDDFEII